MSNRPDSNGLFSRHLPEMGSSLQLDGFSLYLVQRGLLTERDVSASRRASGKADALLRRIIHNCLHLFTGR